MSRMIGEHLPRSCEKHTTQKQRLTLARPGTHPASPQPASALSSQYSAEATTFVTFFAFTVIEKKREENPRAW